MVVIGAGFGGLAVTKGLREADIDVTAIDANNFHTFQPWGSLWEDEVTRMGPSTVDSDLGAYQMSWHDEVELAFNLRAWAGQIAWTDRLSRSKPFGFGSGNFAQDLWREE